MNVSVKERSRHNPDLIISVDESLTDVLKTAHVNIFVESPDGEKKLFDKEGLDVSKYSKQLVKIKKDIECGLAERLKDYWSHMVI